MRFIRTIRNIFETIFRHAKKVSNSGLFDRNVYVSSYIRFSLFRRWPEWHYVLLGEWLGFRPNPFFDPAHYKRNLAKSCPVTSFPLLIFYAEHGAKRTESPSVEFEHSWYSWQNSDWERHGAAPHPLRHMLEVGLPQRRDPSPYIDLRRLLGALAPEEEDAPGTALMTLIRRKGRLEGPGVIRDFAELRSRQAAFRARLNFDVLRRGRPRQRDLVFVQSGRGVRPSYLVHDRGFDILRNYYSDPADEICPHSDHVVFQRGTKATGIAAILRHDPELLLAYENVLFLDDDIVITSAAIEHFFTVMRRRNAMLAQPLLTAASDCVWPLFKNQTYAGHIVPVSSVEVMMPGFSREALVRLGWTFRETISGFGMDLLWGHTLSKEREAGRVVLVGEVQAHHEKPIDDVGGAFYRFMAENGINPKLELWMVMQEHSLMAEFRALTYATAWHERTPPMELQS